MIFTFKFLYSECDWSGESCKVKHNLTLTKSAIYGMHSFRPWHISSLAYMFKCNIWHLLQKILFSLTKIKKNYRIRILTYLVMKKCLKIRRKKQELYCCDFIKQGSVPKPKKNVSLATYKQTKHKGISVTFLVIIIVYVVSYLKFLLIQIHSFIAKSQFIDIGYRLKIYFVCIRLNLLNHIKKNIISICLTTSNFGKN